MKLKYPSKTFLVGEYLALLGGPALVLTTPPHFEVSIENKTQAHHVGGIHTDSPAGRLIAKYQDRFNNVTIRFDDPHHGAGGFGASTAQFAAVYQWLWQRDPLANTDSIRHLLASYHECAWNGEGLPPSGADLIAQFAGGICFFDRETFTVHNFKWPWTSLHYHLIRTGNKIATHEHIRELQAFPAKHLYELVKQASVALEQHHAGNFIAAVNNYHHALLELGFVASNTIEWVDQLITLPGVLAAKGCGALGADVILAITDSRENQYLQNWLQTQGFFTIALS